MLILVFGKTGQVAMELQKFHGLVFLGRNEANLEYPAPCFDKIMERNPDAVINVAAYTNVEKAEQNEELATLINAHSPGAMASACNSLQIPFVHLSTDYVFEGSGSRAWTSSDPTKPINAYGRSKLAGEILISKNTDYYAILRTSWIFSEYGNNFVKTILKLSDEKKEISVVDNQIGGPTSAKSVAAACIEILTELINNREKSGIYHFSGTPNVSWFQFAKKIVLKANNSVTLIPINKTYFTEEASRPLNSRLCCSSLKNAFGITQPKWEKDLDELVRKNKTSAK